MIRIVFFVIFNIALIVTQVIITQGKNWKYGLIIPVFNSITALFIALFTTEAAVSVTRIVDGIKYTSSEFRWGSFIWGFSWKMLILAIPVIINFILYFTARNKSRKIEAENLNKMKINDLD